MAKAQPEPWSRAAALQQRVPPELGEPQLLCARCVKGIQEVENQSAVAVCRAKWACE